MPINLTSSIKELTKIGKTSARDLRNLDIETVEDLLYHFPFRYEDFTQTTLIKDLCPGTNVNVVGVVELIQNKRSPVKRINITEALVSDESGSVRVIWFNQLFLARNLSVGDKVSLSGRAEEDYGGVFLRSPGYEKIVANSGIHTQGLVPNYHLAGSLTQKQMRFALSQVINLADSLPDWLPPQIKTKFNLVSLSLAIQKIHFPSSYGEIEQARRRVAFNEMLLVQIQSQIVRRENISRVTLPAAFHENETKKFVERLPFKLTDAQRKASWEVIQDLKNTHPASRLLEGDVGSGKTIVAALSALNVALSGAQTVLMAPTEILARQHFENLSRLFKDWSITLGLFTRTAKKISLFDNGAQKIVELNKADAAENIINGKTQIIIGTHALIQDDVQFHDLRFVVVDEQHRFGVKQRQALLEKSGEQKHAPHLLSMTATPIPRSLALALYGDLDVSVLDEMPENRKKVITKIVTEDLRTKAYNFVQTQVKSGRQAFVVCPLIDASDKLGVKSVKEEFKKLDEIIFHDIRIGMLHGKIKADEKEKVMQEFLAGEIKILVSTSVIEVGVDVPNASIMMIEGAERFGLAQLHQFRGRVGRGEYQSYCLLFTESDAEKSVKRLESLVLINDGFKLAEADLAMRGPGEFYGTLQKGFPQFKVASLFDFKLMQETRAAAIELLDQDVTLNQWPLLKDQMRDMELKAHLE